jgi:hypothetical protein
LAVLVQVHQLDEVPVKLSGGDLQVLAGTAKVEERVAEKPAFATRQAEALDQLGLAGHLWDLVYRSRARSLMLQAQAVASQVRDWRRPL